MLHHLLTLTLKKEDKIITLPRSLGTISCHSHKEHYLQRNLQKHMHGNVLNKDGIPPPFALT